MEALDPLPEPGAQAVPTLVVEFHVPGEILGAEFSGFRTGSYFSREKAQVVQVAVPEEVADSPDPDGFIFASIREAIELGRLGMAKKGIDYPIVAAIEYLDRIEKAVKSDP